MGKLVAGLPHRKVHRRYVVAMVVDGMSVREILEADPDLEPEDIREALLYAARATDSSPPFPVDPAEGGR